MALPESEMRQYAPYPTILADLVAKMRYRQPWTVPSERAHQGGVVRFVGMGDNEGGNLGLRVARRHDPNVVGLVVSDHDEVLWIACAEDGHPLIESRSDWVKVGSPAHLAALGTDKEGSE